MTAYTDAIVQKLSLALWRTRDKPAPLTFQLKKKLHEKACSFFIQAATRKRSSVLKKVVRCLFKRGRVFAI